MTDGTSISAIETLPPQATASETRTEPRSWWSQVVGTADRRFDALRPLRTAALLSLALFVACHLFQIRSQKDVYFVGKMTLGNDYGFFHVAAATLRAGGNPYAVPGFVTPPTFARVVQWLGLDRLPFESAAARIFWACLAALLLAAALAAVLLWEGRPSDRPRAFGFAVLLLLTGFPAYFLVDRGNIDGFVLVPVTLSLGLLARSARHGSWLEWLAGASLGVAIAFKVYPLLLLWPAAMLGRFRYVLGAAAAVGLAVALDPSPWAYFVFERSAERSLWMVVDEGVGTFTLVRMLADLVQFAGGPALANGPARAIAALCLLALFATMTVAAWRLAPRTRPKDAWKAIACFLPFAVSVPQVVYAYCLVQLLPFLFAVTALHGQRNTGPSERRAWMWAAIGVALAQLQVKALATVLPTGLPPYLVGGLCSIGLFIALVAATRARCIAARPVVVVERAKRIVRENNAAALWYP